MTRPSSRASDQPLDAAAAGVPEHSGPARPLGGVGPFLLALMTWLGAVACAPEGPRTGPVEELLPAGLEGMRVGSTVGELRRVAPGVSFGPYDGLELGIADDPSGFRVARFSTGDLFPEVEPKPEEEVGEIRLAGDSVRADVIGRVSRAFGGRSARVRCVRDRNLEVHVWEDAATPTGAELTRLAHAPGKAELRLFAGRWRGDPVSEKSVDGACGLPAGS